MKLTPLQERLIAAYQQPVHDHALVLKPGATAAASPARDADRLELSPQAAAAQRIRSKLVGGTVTRPAVPEELNAATGVVAGRTGEGNLQLHRTPAAANAAATGVAAGIRLDAIG
ncbi:MAG: hypothetical protein NTV94_02085 [Planctomycetota bacterium]|nr:hypothetical protein [Planctomycetota bacterium]